MEEEMQGPLAAQVAGASFKSGDKEGITSIGEAPLLRYGSLNPRVSSRANGCAHEKEGLVTASTDRLCPCLSAS